MSGPGGGADQLPAPGGAEGETFDAKDVCEQNKNQLETLKEIMLRNKQSLKKKEEEVQEYARKLSKIKSRTKLSRRSRDASSSVEGTPEAVAKSRISSPLVENFDDVVDDISQATTPKAKSSLLQKKLAENRKIFEQRSREMTENKRAVEEKVEAIRQQLDESDTTISELHREISTVLPVQPVVVTTQVTSGSALQHFNPQDKDNRIAELSNRVLQLEATVIDLEENLKEKDSVIDSKTKAITLMSADLSLKSKSTLDTLEDTKDEMRSMQANFVLIETSLKHKIDSLLQQLQGRDGQIAEYENTVEGLKEDLEKRKITDTATADFSRSTLDTLAEAKDAMKSMQENFVLIESSLKSKNNNLLEQLQEREIKLAEAEERIFNLESGAGIVTPPDVKELRSKLEIIEQRNRQLQDDKYELQKSIAELQDKVISNEPAVGNGLIVEKDNRIAELENLIEELRKSNQLLLEESKTELQNQIVELTAKNEDYSNKVNDLEKILHDLETEKNELIKRIPEDNEESREDAKVAKLSKELDELNKSMIKLKAQHKSKVKSLQKQLESFKKVSDANAELVKLGNQVTLLEEEKGNLQLSLVDFDELKASAGDWQERIADLETKISAQSNEIDSQVQAIAALENQKLDLMQELHTVKQEVSALEAENAESENLRVTAEMKVVELEEQLDSLHKSIVEPKQSDSANEFNKNEYLDKIEILTQENHNLIIKLTKLEEKATSDAGSTESFETFHETDRNELLKKIEILTQENNEMIIRLTKLEEKTSSSTDSFETFNDATKNELLKKIDLLAQENNNLIIKLGKLEEKSSSDSGSTESFERIPEHVDNLSRLDMLTQENNELVIKLIKMEEKFAQIEESHDLGSKSETTADTGLSTLENRIHTLTQENNDLVIQLTKLQEKMVGQLTETTTQQDNTKNIEEDERAKALADENNSLVIDVTKLGEKNENLKINLDLVTKERDELKSVVDQMTTNTFAKELIEKLNELNKRNQTSAQSIREEITKLLHKLTEETIETEDVAQIEESAGYQGSVTVSLLENEIEDCRKFISEQKEMIEDMKSKLSEKEEELELQSKKITEYEASGENLDKLQIELTDTLSVIEEWKLKCNEMEEKMKILESEKSSIEEGLRILETENAHLVKQSEEKDLETVKLKKELDDTISQFESRLNEEVRLVSAREEEIAALKEVIANTDADLHDKYQKLQNEMITIDSLQDDLNNYKTQFQEQRNTIESLTEEIGKLNATSVTKSQEIQQLHVELTNSKGLEEEFNRLVKTLNDNQEIMKQMQNKIDQQVDENLAARTHIDNITQNIQNMQDQLIRKQEEIAQLTKANKYLNEELNQAKTLESSTTTEISQLHGTIEQNHIYLEDLRKELGDSYRKLELVKSQHVEDTGMQNRRLEDLIEELNSKVQVNESLKAEIEEKQKLLGQNVTEEIKLALEMRVADLEEKLSESEVKAKAQLDKMKKIAAHLKKKTTQCQELEAKVSDLEEKWNSEKCEKETINKSIQDNESDIREKEIKISELEKRARESGDQASMALENVGGLMQEIDVSKEKVASLLEQVTEMGEEIEKLREALNTKALELEEERTAKENILSEYEADKLQMRSDYEKQQQDLEETTEKARELRVRMEVMESGYVEQLALIQKLKAENGMLSSKETQINEKLENAEKESEERKYQLEKLQKEKADVIDKVEAHKAQTLDCEMRENVAKTSQEHCQTSVQALEAKLQERDAVVESLETELGKSNDRINKLEEALLAVEERRHSLEKRTELLGAELEQSFRITEEASYSEDMLEQRLATLMAKDEAINEKLNETIDENNELTEKIQSLQDLNISLQERIDAVEEELKYGKETNEKLQNVDVLYTELVQKHSLQENELKKTQQELRSAKQHIDSSEREVTSQINQLDSEKKQLLEKCEKLEDLRTNLIQEIESLKDGVSLCRQRISDLEAEVETYKEVNGQLTLELNNRKESVSTSQESSEDIEKLKSLLAEKEVEIENYQRRNMQLQMAAFDAPKSFDVSNVFDTTVVSDTSLPAYEMSELTNRLSQKEHQNARISTELDNLKQQLFSSQSEYEKLANEKEQYNAHLVTELQNIQTEYNQCQNQIVRLNEINSEKQQEIDSLNLQLGDIGSQLQIQGNSQGDYNEELNRLLGIVNMKEEKIEAVRKELNLANEELETMASSEKESNSQLENVKSVYESQLHDFRLQQQEAEEIVKQIISVAEDKVNELYKTQDKRCGTETTGLRKVASRFNELLAEFENLKLERDELLRSQESYGNEITELRRQLADNTADTNSELVQNLQNRLEQQELMINQVRKELEEVSNIKQSLENQVSELTMTITQLRGQQSQEAIDNNSEEPISESKSVEETVEKTVQLEVGSEWDTGSTGKLDNEEEGWGWSAEEAQLEEQHQLSTAPLRPSAEIQLQTRIGELEDQVKDLETKIKVFDEESKAVQLKNVKLVKKLKEFKVQNDQLQQKMKQQQPSCFSDLDSAIEEELKSQIDRLEKSLKDATQEQKNAVSEKEHLLKRLEVLTAANERFVEMKERQDMDVEVWQIRNKELNNKVQSLEWQLQEILSNADPEGYSRLSSRTESQIGPALSETDRSGGRTSGRNEQTEELCKRYKEELDDLKEEMEALASENEQLQNLLEEQKVRSTSVETKVGADRSSNMNEVEKLSEENQNLQTSLNKLQEEYSLLRKQYEQSLMDANDQVTAMRQNNDLLRTELDTKSMEFENDKELLAREMEEWPLKVKELEQHLQQAKQENSDLMQKVEALKSSEEKLSSVSISLADVTELLNTRVQEVAELKQNYQQQYLERTEAENRLRSDIENISEELNKKRDEISNLRQSLSAKETEIKQQQNLEMHSLQVELVNKEAEIEKLRPALSSKETIARKSDLESEHDASLIETLQKEIESLRKMLLEKETSIAKITAELTIKYQESAELESYLEWYRAEIPKYSAEIERNRKVIIELNNAMSNQPMSETDATISPSQSVDVNEKEREINELKVALHEKNSLNEWNSQEVRRLSEELSRVTAEVTQLKQQPEDKNLELEKLSKDLVERDSVIEKIRQDLNEKQRELDSFNRSESESQNPDTVALADSFPRFKMTSDNDFRVETDVESLKSELKEKDAEIEHLKYVLSENTYPEIIQQLQDSISQLHNDKYQTEQSLEKRIESLKEELASKQPEIDSLRQQVQVQQQETVPRDNIKAVATERPVLFDQETIPRLQNELHTKEQEINELRYLIAEKDSQISLQANSGPQFDEYEAEEALQRLNGELYAKQQEVEYLRATLDEKGKDIGELMEMKNLSEEDKDLILKLTSEKELMKEEAERLLQFRLAEKEAEIGTLKQRLAEENQELLDTVQLKDEDIKNLRIQMEQINSEYSETLQRREEELVLLKTDLDEKDRQLAEVSITKDTEIHNLRIQIHDQDIRIEELIALTEEEERQLIELREIVESKEGEINNLKALLTETVQEYEIIQKALKRGKSPAITNLPLPGSQVEEQTSAVASSSEESENMIPSSDIVSVEGELDRALYMLHQRDVRCEELTVELMQLLEERDTLQLRLSNAIRVNEELRRQKSTTSSPRKDSQSMSLDEPLVEHPSPSKTDGPVEIAREAAETSPIGEDKKALAENSRRSEPVERSDELAVGKKHAEGNAHVMKAIET